MGRKNKKEKTDKPKKSYTRAYISRLSPELKEHLALTHEGYFTADESLEIMECIKYFDHWIWSEIWNDYLEDQVEFSSSGWIISTETVKEIIATDEPPENVTDNPELIITLLTAEALKKDFDNLLVYTRFLKLCCIKVDEETGEGHLVVWEEQDRIKKMERIRWRFRKWGVYIKEADSMSTHVWKFPELCDC